MKLAVIRIRGVNRVSHPIEKTLRQLHLYRRNYCSIVPDTPSYKGMLAKIKDYVTYGPIDDETHKSLLEKKGVEYKGPLSDATGKVSYSTRFVDVGKQKYLPYFRLHPPRGGFERKGTKKAYTLGGALGYRGEHIKKLLERMMKNDS